MRKIKRKLATSAVCALLLAAVCVSAVCASERGMPGASSLSGLSDLIGMLGTSGLGEVLSGSAAGGSSGSGTSSKEDTSGTLQEILELLGVAGEIPLKEVTVSKIDDREYTGKEIKPVPKLTYNGKTLKRGTDFSLTYTDNVRVGTAKCKITGKGSYKGTRTVSFKIVKKGTLKNSSNSGTSNQNRQKKFTVKLSVSEYEYSGSPRKPSVKVTASGKSVPSSGYTVSYANNKNVGTATVTVKGKGDYKGYNGTATFRILLKKVTISSVKSTEKESVTVVWKADTQADGYQLEYATNKAFSGTVKKKQITDAKTVTCVLEKIASGKTCYVRMRAFKKGSSRNTYGPWGTVKDAKVK